jgi:hypothetical protein
MVLWVTSGVWAFASDTMPLNKSDTNINRDTVFMFSPIQTFD